MGGDIKTEIVLEFEKKNKDKVKKLIIKTFKSDYTNDFKFNVEKEDCLEFTLNDWELEEEDFKDFKPLCYYICMQEYEILDSNGFIWEDEEEDNEEVKVLKAIEEKQKKEMPLTDIEQEIISSPAFK